jgi:hypothetical protein
MDEDLRDDTGHDTLIIAEKEDAQGNKYTGKITEQACCQHLAMALHQGFCRTYIRPLPVRPRRPVPGMMAESRRVAPEGRRGRTSGISIASLLTRPGCNCDCRGLCSDTDLRNWTRLCLERLLSTTLASSSSLSDVSARRNRRGSSSSASCSAMSPVSVQESKSVSAESESADGRSSETASRVPANNDVDWAP